MNKMYECSICLSVNHVMRFSCQNCGTIPARYSVIGKPMKMITAESMNAIPVVVAIGAVHACKHHAARVNLRTVAADYYAN